MVETIFFSLIHPVWYNLDNAGSFYNLHDINKNSCSNTIIVLQKNRVRSECLYIFIFSNGGGFSLRSRAQRNVFPVQNKGVVYRLGPQLGIFVFRDAVYFKREIKKIVRLFSLSFSLSGAFSSFSFFFYFGFCTRFLSFFLTSGNAVIFFISK